MLDFYLIKRDSPNPRSPKNLEFVGGLESHTFSHLKKLQIISDNFDYYSDFRWDIGLIESMLLKTEHLNSQNTDVKQIHEILTLAQKNQCALFAFCD
ncbi:MAG: hypothetical protein MRY83_02300 [Flavobacteriales bacterium]|nr:hypothetical protein [Flavobacteriales bacterium]